VTVIVRSVASSLTVVVRSVASSLTVIVRSVASCLNRLSQTLVYGSEWSQCSSSA
jgi:hypothetical protein